MRSDMHLFYDTLKFTKMDKQRLIDLDINEYQELIDQIIDKKIASLVISREREEELLTRREVIKRLKIAPSTLSDYTKKGILNAYNIGHRVYYRWSEILNTGIKVIK
jgi:hypothetical protein